MKVEKPRIAWIGSLSSLPDDDDGKCFSRARRPESSELGNRFLSCRRGLTFSHNQDPDRTSCACSSSGAIQWAGVVFPYPMNCASAPRRAARSREVVDIKRERDWRLCAGTPISTTEIGEGAFPINGGNHEDLEQAAGSRAGSWPRGYELPSGRDRHHLTVSSNLLTL